MEGRAGKHWAPPKGLSGPPRTDPRWAKWAGEPRDPNRCTPQAGYDYLHVAVDDRSRFAYVEVHADERGPTCAGLLLRCAEHFASLGVRIESVMTDQPKNYTVSGEFGRALAELGTAHLLTRPYRPRTNGKAEWFNRTMLAECS